MQKFDARQVASRDVLQRIALATGTQLDALLRSLNAEVTPPFNLFPSATPDRVLNVGASKVVNPLTGRTRTVAAIGSDTPNLTSGTITLPAASGGQILCSPGVATTLTLASGQWVKATIYIDALNQLNVLLGTPGASEAAATALPAPDSTLAIGFLSIQNIGGVIQNVTNANIYQFVGVGGAGGSGNANELIERLKDYFEDSAFEMLTPIIFANDKDTLTDTANTTGAYSVINKTYLLNAGQQFTSKEMVDPDFKTEGRDITKIDLVAFWRPGAIDTAAIYRVTRNGVDYQTVTMSRVKDTDTFSGTLEFAEETATAQSAVATGTAVSLQLNLTNQRELSQRFTLTDTKVMQTLTNVVANKTGNPVGDLWFEIRKDNAGQPGDLVATSSIVQLRNLATGDNTLNLAIGSVLVAGTYHLVSKVSSAYAGGISLATRTGSGAPAVLAYNGTTYSAPAADALQYSLMGRAQSMKIQVVSSANAKELAGVGLYYGITGAPIVTGVKNQEVFVFSGNSNVTTFALSKFKPNPELLQVYDVNSGKVYRYGAFTLSGSNVIFNPGQFLAPGETITLRFEQMTGGAYDNSDDNANLLAENRLGSKDATLDRSAPGEGIMLRSTNGQLVEVWVEYDAQSDAHFIRLSKVN